MDMLTTLTQSLICLLIAVAIVGAASAIVRGLAMLADITPTTRDGLPGSKVQAALSALSAFLDRLALNPDRDSARAPD